MAEYIIKQKVTDRMGCCLANAKAEYKSAKDEFTKARFGDYISAIQAMIDVVECSETADVQPIRRGKWINDKDFYTCSRCNHQFLIDKILSMTIYPSGGMPYYCPCCGADMREPETTKG